jgi:protein-S-isoprenylcysteine O-methyltransferase Ste14
MPADDWRWPEGWLFLIILMGYAGIQGVYLLKYDPGLAEERMRSKWPERGWDRAIISLLYPAMIAMIFIPGFDRRYGWSDLPSWLQFLGLIATLLGFYLTFLVMRENSFLSASVKIQAERGHKVITTGPYAIIRHPMYAATFLYCLGIPLLLDSSYGLIAGLFSIALLVLRTVLEDKTLHEELEGYPEYAAVTRYKLVPGLW